MLTQALQCMAGMAQQLGQMNTLAFDGLRDDLPIKYCISLNIEFVHLKFKHQSYIKQAIVMGPCGSLNWETTKTTSQHVNYTLFPIQLALVDSTYSHKYCIRCDFISNVWKCLANGWSIWNLILMLCISVSHAVPVSYLWDFQVYIIRGREFITPASKSIQNLGFEWESSSAPFERAYG